MQLCVPICGWAVAAVILLQGPPAVAQDRRDVVDPGGRTAAAGCGYRGRGYPERSRTEGSSPGHLCLPAGTCFTASVMLPIYQCIGGRWRCVKNCPR